MASISLVFRTHFFIWGVLLQALDYAVKWYLTSSLILSRVSNETASINGCENVLYIEDTF